MSLAIYSNEAEDGASAVHVRRGVCRVEQRVVSSKWLDHKTNAVMQRPRGDSRFFHPSQAKQGVVRVCIGERHANQVASRVTRPG